MSATRRIKLIINNTLLTEIQDREWLVNRWMLAEKAGTVRGKKYKYQIKPDQNILIALPTEYRDRITGKKVLSLDATFVVQDNDQFFVDKHHVFHKLASYQLLVSAKIDADMKAVDGVECYQMLGALWFEKTEL